MIFMLNTSYFCYMRIQNIHLSLLVLSFSLILYSCGSDSENNFFLLEQKSLTEIKAFENTQDSEEIEGIYHGKAPSNFFPERDKLTLDNSLMFLRDGNEIPLKTAYYFTPDSTVELIVYEWNVAQPGMNVKEVEEATATEDKKWKLYNGLFYSISEEIGKLYGHPTRGDGKTIKEKSALYDLWKKEVYWELEDKTIELKLIWMPKPGFKHFKILVKAYGFK